MGKQKQQALPILLNIRIIFSLEHSQDVQSIALAAQFSNFTISHTPSMYSSIEAYSMDIS